MVFFYVIFQTMLMNSKWSDSHQEVIELQEVPQCIEAFPVFLQYFYSGVITLEQTNIMPISVLADKYNVNVCSCTPLQVVAKFYIKYWFLGFNSALHWVYVRPYSWCGWAGSISHMVPVCFVIESAISNQCNSLFFILS